MALDRSIAFARQPLESLAVENLDRAAAIGDGPQFLQLARDRVDRRALHPEQRGQRFLGQRQPIAADAVLRGQQPAQGARLDRVESVARDRLCDLREQIVGVAAEQVAQERRVLLDRLQRIERDGQRRPGDLHFGKTVGGGKAAADDPADRAFLPDRGDLDRARAVELDDHRDHQRIERENAVGDRFSRAEYRFAALIVDDAGERLDLRAHLVGEGASSRFRSKAMVMRAISQAIGLSIRRHAPHNHQ